MAKTKKVVTVAPPPPEISFQGKEGSKVDFVHPGQFDGAFDSSIGFTNAILNSDSAEEDNFVGADSKRFFIRVFDPAQVNPDAKTTRTLRVNWRTLDPGKSLYRDDGGSDPSLNLFEKSVGSGEFVSQWLLLSTDPWELQNVPTTTGRAGDGTRTHGRRDYRLRLCTVHDLVEAEFPTGNLVHVPVFNRSPEERRKIPLQIFVFSNMDSPAMRNYVLGPDLENMRIVYARLGLLPHTVVDPDHAKLGTRVDLNGESLIVIPVPTAPPAAQRFRSVSEDVMKSVAEQFTGLKRDGTRGLPPVTDPSDPSGTNTTPCITDTIRIFYVPALASGVNGETYPDDFAHDPRRCASFVGDALPKVASGMGSAAAHEIGHSLTRHKDVHFQQPTPVKRFFQQPNLMCDGTVAGGTGVSSSQRLWDVLDGGGQNQWFRIRGSRLTRDF